MGWVLSGESGQIEETKVTKEILAVPFLRNRKPIAVVDCDVFVQ
jgi:hypothetical protein